MKRLLFVVLAAALLLPFVAGCAVVTPASTVKSPTDGGTPTVTLGIALTADDFAADAHPVKDVTLDYDNYFTVTLDANPTTGYQWNSDAVITGGAVVQVEHQYQEPTSTLVGAPGKDVWTFRAVRADTATVNFSYARPFESVPPTWTLTLNVTVK